jgi:hypothetical protein
VRYAVVDYRGTYPTTKGDMGSLAALARQLVGEQVLFGAVSYPRELTVHFGTPVEFKGPKGATLAEGSYVLGAVGSAWAIKSAPQGRRVIDYAAPYEPHHLLLLKTISEPELEDFLGRVGGAIVRDVELFPTAYGYGLRVFLSDGSLIEVFPTETHFEIDMDDDIPIQPPDWELFTPYKRYLRVGPGSEWGYHPSDQPEEKAGSIAPNT